MVGHLIAIAKLAGTLARALAAVACIAAPQAGATVYTVGPGATHATPLTVPWATLAPGDVVEIRWQAEPYKAKWVICRQGSAAQPITVRGVPSPSGELPVIEGSNATTAAGLNYTGGTRSLLKIGSANVPADTTPQYIVIENLHLRAARPPYQFTDHAGVVRSYVNHTAPLWIEKGEHITVRNCTLSDGGNGFMVSSTDALPSRDILVEGCHIHSNGNLGSLFEHNVYTAAIGIVFQFNRLGPLRAGARGNNLKDRSAGLVVRYNWIEAGNRQLDLVHGEDSSAIREAPEYRTTFVYGNVLLEPAPPVPGEDNRQMVHYGGDNDALSAQYRKGTLHFFHNTVVSRRTDMTALFRLSTNEERCDARNNVLYTPSAGSTFRLIEVAGNLVLTQNWIKTGWQLTTPSGHAGNVTGTATFLTGTSPSFADEVANRFDLRPGSPALDAAAALDPAASAHAVNREYVPHQRSKTRTPNSSPDLGAFELEPLDAWRWQEFGESSLAADISNDLADPDLDGAPNFLEYSSATDPLDGASLPAPHLVAHPVPGGDHPALRFRRLNPPAGVVYRVRWGETPSVTLDGHIFSDTGISPGSGVTTDQGNVEGYQTVRSLIPFSAADRQFFALDVALDP